MVQNNRTLIIGTEQQNTNYWYRTARKHSIIYTGVVGVVSPGAITINYHLVCTRQIHQMVSQLQCYTIKQQTYPYEEII